MFRVTVYHNTESRFMPYEDGQELTAITCHWLPARADTDAQAIADWAWHTFNADLPLLEADRARTDGETTFLAACVYRLLGHRSLSVGDVIEILHGEHATRTDGGPLPSPEHRTGQPLTAAAVYQHLAAHRARR